jgi:hypothetical protein
MAMPVERQVPTVSEQTLATTQSTPSPKTGLVPRVVARLVVGLAMCALLLTSCGETSGIGDFVSSLTEPPDGGTSQIPTTQIPTSQIPTTQIPTTQIPTTQTPTTQPPLTGSTVQVVPTTISVGVIEVTERRGPSATTWLILASMAFAAAAIFALAFSRAEREQRIVTPGPANLQRSLRDVRDGARWAHDSGSLQVLLLEEPQQVRHVWNFVRRRMVKVESRIETVGVGTGYPTLDENLRTLGHRLAQLRASEEAYVEAKVGSDGTGPDEDIVRRTNDNVLIRRQHVEVAIGPATTIPNPPPQTSRPRFGVRSSSPG